MNNCKYCKYWGTGKRESEMKSCSAPDMNYGYAVDESKMKPYATHIEDDEGWGMVTGPLFGCVLYEDKE